jgi:hypothetical protein
LSLAAVPKYFKFDAFLKGVLAICSDDVSRSDMNKYLILIALKLPTRAIQSFYVFFQERTFGLPSPKKKTPPQNTRRRCVPFNLNHSWFSWTSQIVYSKAKLENIGDKAPPSCVSF